MDQAPAAVKLYDELPSVTWKPLRISAATTWHVILHGKLFIALAGCVAVWCFAIAWIVTLWATTQLLVLTAKVLEHAFEEVESGTNKSAVAKGAAVDVEQKREQSTAKVGSGIRLDGYVFDQLLGVTWADSDRTAEAAAFGSKSEASSAAPFPSGDKHFIEQLLGSSRGVADQASSPLPQHDAASPTPDDTSHESRHADDGRDEVLERIMLRERKMQEAIDAAGLEIAHAGPAPSTPHHDAASDHQDVASAEDAWDSDHAEAETNEKEAAAAEAETVASASGDRPPSSGWLDNNDMSLDEKPSDDEWGDEDRAIPEARSRHRPTNEWGTTTETEDRQTAFDPANHPRTPSLLEKKAHAIPHFTLSMEERKAKAQSSWLSEVNKSAELTQKARKSGTVAKGNGQNDGWATNEATSRGSTPAENKPPASTWPAFSAEQLAEARSFSKEATKGGHKQRPPPGPSRPVPAKAAAVARRPHVSSVFNSRNVAQASASQRAQYANKTSTAVTAGRTAHPLDARTTHAAPTKRQSVGGELPPHLRKQQAAIQKKSSSGTEIVKHNDQGSSEFTAAKAPVLNAASENIYQVLHVDELASEPSTPVTFQDVAPEKPTAVPAIEVQPAFPATPISDVPATVPETPAVTTIEQPSIRSMSIDQLLAFRSSALSPMTLPPEHSRQFSLPAAPDLAQSAEIADRNGEELDGGHERKHRASSTSDSPERRAALEKAVDVLNNQAHRKRESLSHLARARSRSPSRTRHADTAPPPQVAGTTSNSGPLDLLDLEFESTWSPPANGATSAHSSRRVSSLDAAALPFFSPSTRAAPVQQPTGDVPDTTATIGSSPPDNNAAWPSAPSVNHARPNYAGLSVEDKPESIGGTEAVGNFDGIAGSCGGKFKKLPQSQRRKIDSVERLHTTACLKAFADKFSLPEAMDNSLAVSELQTAAKASSDDGIFAPSSHTQPEIDGVLSDLSQQQLGLDVEQHVDDEYVATGPVQPAATQLLPMGLTEEHYSEDQHASTPYGILETTSPEIVAVERENHTTELTPSSPSYYEQAAVKGDQPTDKKVRKQQKKALREELVALWWQREHVRKKAQGTGALHLGELEMATRSYNQKRDQLRAFAGNGELNQEDTKAFPVLAVSDIRAPKHHPPVVDDTSSISHNSQHDRSDFLFLFEEPQHKKRDELRRNAKVALDRHDEAIAFFRRGPPQGRKDLKQQASEGMAKVDRAVKYYRKKRDALQAAFPGDVWLGAELPEVCGNTKRCSCGLDCSVGERRREELDA